MQRQAIKQLPIFRMTHFDNVPFIVNHGLWSKRSAVQDPNFVPIGNPAIIDRRTNKQVNIEPPGGVLGDFVPFYFSGHSPMLLNIATGHGVNKVPQKDIVFLVCDALEIINAGIPYCFTNGNATNTITRFYNSLYGLNDLDWATIRASLWANTDDDYDRVRKKMSEFLVKEHVPIDLIKRIIVRNEEASQKVAAMLNGALPQLEIIVDTKNDYYYRQYD